MQHVKLFYVATNIESLYVNTATNVTMPKEEGGTVIDCMQIILREKKYRVES